MKHVLITGGTRGIGLACVKKFAQMGDSVTALYSSDEESAQKAREQNPGVNFIRANVADDETVKKVFEGISSLDVLINNAGVSSYGLVQDVSLSEWQRVLSVNAGGTFLCCKYAVRKLLERGGGSIVNIASIWGEIGGSCESIYSASKGAVIAFTKALAKELAPSGITVNAVSPGAIETEMNAHLTEEERKEIAQDIPLGRFGLPEEVAEAVYFLSRQKYVTGVDLAVNGGWNM